MDAESVINIKFQSTRPMRGATAVAAVNDHRSVISIHAPHAGRDTANLQALGLSQISIHAPHAGRDLDVALG